MAVGHWDRVILRQDSNVGAQRELRGSMSSERDSEMRSASGMSLYTMVALPTFRRVLRAGSACTQITILIEI